MAWLFTEMFSRCLIGSLGARRLGRVRNCAGLGGMEYLLLCDVYIINIWIKNKRIVWEWILLFCLESSGMNWKFMQTIIYLLFENLCKQYKRIVWEWIEWNIYYYAIHIYNKYINKEQAYCLGLDIVILLRVFWHELKMYV